MNKINKVAVSIVLPCYNSEKVIKKVVDNLLSTKYKNFELVIIDDGSIDNTYNVLRKYYSKNPKIRIYRNHKNLGIAPTKDRGIKLARGKYISIMETDMEVDPGWLSPVVRELDTNFRLAGVQSKILDIRNKKLIETYGSLLVPQTFWVITKGISQHKDKFNKKEYAGIGLGGVTLRKSVLRKIGRYDEKCQYAQGDADSNWPIWIMGYKTVAIPDSLVYHETAKPISKSKVKGFIREFHFHKTPRVFLKNYETKNIVRYLPQLLFIYLVRDIRHLLKRNYYPILGLFAAAAWNIWVLPDTLRRRAEIQKLRKRSDEQVSKDICVEGTFYNIYKSKLMPVIAAFENYSEDKTLKELNKTKFSNI